MKLPLTFYKRKNVVKIARELLGKYVFTNINGIVTGGIITETEAYNGEIDKASHSYGGRRTARTEIMYADGGIAYVYLCYGIHSLLNVVTNKKEIPHAILIRSIYPVEGIDEMIRRRRKPNLVIEKLCIGPGTVSQALGIHYNDSGKKLTGNEIWIEDRKLKIPSKNITIGPRIGVDYAGKDAFLPYRFCAKVRAKNQEPRAKNQEPRTKSQEPRAKSKEPRTKNQEPRAKSKEQRAKSKEQRIKN